MTADEETSKQIRKLVSVLAGISDVKPDLKLKDIGLTSQLYKAMLTTLKSSVRGARNLNLQDLVLCETVADLEAACSGTPKSS